MLTEEGFSEVSSTTANNVLEWYKHNKKYFSRFTRARAGRKEAKRKKNLVLMFCKMLELNTMTSSALNRASYCHTIISSWACICRSQNRSKWECNSVENAHTVQITGVATKDSRFGECHDISARTRWRAQRISFFRTAGRRTQGSLITELARGTTRTRSRHL